MRDLGALLQRAGFALPVTDIDRVTVRYESVFALMHDLRRMGATNALIDRRRAPLRRATLMRMAEIYAERFSDADGRVRATFEIVWLSGWAPHPEPAAAAQARLGQSAARRCARHARNIERVRRRGVKSRLSAHSAREAGIQIEIGAVTILGYPPFATSGLDFRSCRGYFNAVATLLIQAFTLAPKVANVADDGNGDAGSDQRIFDRGAAALVVAESGESDARIARVEDLNMAFCLVVAVTTASVRCGISGSSAGGIG